MRGFSQRNDVIISYSQKHKNKNVTKNFLIEKYERRKSDSRQQTSY